MRYGVERWQLGCDVLGAFIGRELVAALHVGANLVPINVDTPELAQAFAAKLGTYRCSSSIMGDARQVRLLFDALTQGWNRAWKRPRDCRWSQPLLAIDGPPAVAPDPRVDFISIHDFSPYLAASIAMYTDEVGVDPMAGGDTGYAGHIREVLLQRRGLGIVENGAVIYKSDLAAPAGMMCQVQGVWLDPALRGQHLAAPMMAGVVAKAQQKYPIVTLYVNDFNAPALALYRSVGFHQCGELATVLY